MRKESMLSQRGQMFLAGLALWLLLALWSLSAFWQHIDELRVTYPMASKAGAAASEMAVLILILWKCFNAHINVRKWSLIFSIALSAAILIHAGALRGMGEARSVQNDTEKRLAETLTKMSKEQMESTRRKADVAKEAQRQLADTVRAGADKVKDSSILPRWYLDGWMYSLLFILSLLFVGAAGLLMMNKEDIDENFDGIPDHQQQGREIGGVPIEGFARASHEGQSDPKG